jgi:hypothetical protein
MQHQIIPGHFVWAPPPAAADVALEELRKAWIKRQESTHYFVCPRLLMPKWLKQLWKTADLIIQIPAGTPGWPANIFEPLMIGFVFPYLSHRPWQLKETAKMFHLAQEVRHMFKALGVDSGNLLCKLLLDCSRLNSMSPDVVRRVQFFRSSGELLREPLGKQQGQKRKRPTGQGTVSKGLGEQATSSGCLLVSAGRLSRFDPV